MIAMSHARIELLQAIVIPGQPAGLNPESRDSGFALLARSGMTVCKI
jgi:hypothetical protein